MNKIFLLLTCTLSLLLGGCAHIPGGCAVLKMSSVFGTEYYERGSSIIPGVSEVLDRSCDPIAVVVHERDFKVHKKNGHTTTETKFYRREDYGRLIKK